MSTINTLAVPIATAVPKTIVENSFSRLVRPTRLSHLRASYLRLVGAFCHKEYNRKFRTAASAEKGSWVKMFLTRQRGRCKTCGTKTARTPPLRGSPEADQSKLCFSCEKANPSYKKVTKTTAKKEYKLSDADLDTLDCLVLKNPHYRSAAPMRLYLLRAVKDCAAKKQEK